MEKLHHFLFGYQADRVVRSSRYIYQYFAWEFIRSLCLNWSNMSRRYWKKWIHGSDCILIYKTYEEIVNNLTKTEFNFYFRQALTKWYPQCDMKKVKFLLVNLSQILSYTLQTTWYGMTTKILGKLLDHLWLQINTINWRMPHTECAHVHGTGSRYRAQVQCIWYCVQARGYRIRWLRETRRYGPLCGPTSSSCGGLRPSSEGFFCPSGKKRPYYAVLANFRPSLVSSSDLSNF